MVLAYMSVSNAFSLVFGPRDLKINGWEALCNMTENTVNGGERVHY